MAQKIPKVARATHTYKRTEIRLTKSLQTFVRGLAAALLLSSIPLAFSQSITTGDVTGAITDATGAIVPGTTVTLTYTDKGETRTAVTNNSGHYRFSLLKPGGYTVFAQTSGMKSSTSKFSVLVGQEQARISC